MVRPSDVEANAVAAAVAVAAAEAAARGTEAELFVEVGRKGEGTSNGTWLSLKPGN